MGVELMTRDIDNVAICSPQAHSEPCLRRSPQGHIQPLQSCEWNGLAPAHPSTLPISAAAVAVGAWVYGVYKMSRQIKLHLAQNDRKLVRYAR